MKTAHIIFYKKRKKLSILILDTERGRDGIDTREIEVDHANFAELEDYPKLELCDFTSSHEGTEVKRHVGRG